MAFFLLLILVGACSATELLMAVQAGRSSSQPKGGEAMSASKRAAMSRVAGLRGAAIGFLIVLGVAELALSSGLFSGPIPSM